MNGLLTNNGALAQIKDAPASFTTEFLHLTNAAGTVDKYHGVDLTPAAAMGVTTVQIKGNQTACTTNAADPIVLRCFRIDPATQSAATVRFWYTEAERHGQAANALRLWHWSPWTQVGVSGNYAYSESGATCTSGSGQACWFQSTGVSTYSPFVLGSGTTPTAIQLRHVEARTNTGGAVVLALATILTGLILLTIKFKRRSA